jgi:hypothetical protein
MSDDIDKRKLISTAGWLFPVSIGAACLYAFVSSVPVFEFWMYLLRVLAVVGILVIYLCVRPGLLDLAYIKVTLCLSSIYVILVCNMSGSQVLWMLMPVVITAYIDVNMGIVFALCSAALNYTAVPALWLVLICVYLCVLMSLVRKVSHLLIALLCIVMQSVCVFIIKGRFEIILPTLGELFDEAVLLGSVVCGFFVRRVDREQGAQPVIPAKHLANELCEAECFIRDPESSTETWSADQVRNDKDESIAVSGEPKQVTQAAQAAQSAQPVIPAKHLANELCEAECFIRDPESSTETWIADQVRNDKDESIIASSTTAVVPPIIAQRGNRLSLFAAEAAEAIDADVEIAQLIAIYYGCAAYYTYHESLEVPDYVARNLHRRNINNDRPQTVCEAVVMMADFLLSCAVKLNKLGRESEMHTLIDNIFARCMQERLWDDCGITTGQFNTLREFFKQEAQ